LELILHSWTHHRLLGQLWLQLFVGLMVMGVFNASAVTRIRD
jgi:hypothetical protein